MAAKPLPTIPDHVYRIEARILNDPSGNVRFVHAVAEYPKAGWAPDPTVAFNEEMPFVEGHNSVTFIGTPSTTGSKATMTVSVVDVETNPEKVRFSKSVKLDAGPAAASFFFVVA